MGSMFQFDADRRDRYLLFYLISAPAFVDLINGYAYFELGTGILGQAYRASVLALLFLIMWRGVNRQLFFWLVGSGAVAAGIVFAILLKGQSMHFSISLEVTKLLDILLYAFVLVILVTVPKPGIPQRAEQIEKQLGLYGVYTAAILIVSYIADFGFPTYYSKATGQPYAFGFTGYYIANNTLSVVMLVPAAINLHRFQRDSSWTNLGFIILNIAGLIALGTRTGILGGVVMFVGLLAVVILSKRIRSIMRTGALLMTIPAALFAAVNIYQYASQYSRAMERFVELSQLNVRSDHSSAAERYMAAQSNLDRLIGNGFSSYVGTFNAFINKQDAVRATAEKDLVDIQASYGLVGLILFFSPMILGLFASFWIFWVRGSLFHSHLFLAMTVLVTHSVLAGHVLHQAKVTQMTGALLALILLELYRTRQAQQPQETVAWAGEPTGGLRPLRRPDPRSNPGPAGQVPAE
ncbi:MAG: O-antigen ligase family protein [Pseudomonadota bacterium]